MPFRDGTGPRGEGPMTGRGQGYCAVDFAQPPGAVRSYGGRLFRWSRPLASLGRAFGRGRGAGRGRGGGRGRRW